MATLVVPVSTNFSAVVLSNITIIDFANTAADATATFSNTQFNNVAILNNVQFDGSSRSNYIVVSGGSVDASGWVFSNWIQFGDDVTLFGSSGDDVITGPSQGCAIVGGDGADSISGSQLHDRLLGDEGNDTIYGGDGEDYIYGGGGFDALYGGLGDDVITDIDASAVYGGDGADIMSSPQYSGGFWDGGPGIDSISLFGYSTGAIIDLGAASFSYLGATFSNFESVDGTLGNDTIIGGSGFNAIGGSFGDDTIYGGGGGDGLSGSDGDDTIYGGGGIDTLTGDGGNDTLNGGAFKDESYGGPGNDTFKITGADIGDDVYGIYGIDVLDLSGWTNAAVAFSVNLLTQSYQQLPNAIGVNGAYIAQDIDHVRGSNFNDIITGDGAANVIVGGGGADALAGGDGNDRFYVNSASDAVTENAGAPAGHDMIFAALSYAIAANVERLYLLEGGNYNATGRDGQNDIISGNDGANAISGLSGNDTLNGGLGNDTLTGGLGSDVFQFRTAPNSAANKDVITDFNLVNDTIQMENAVYTLLGANGALAANLFRNLTLGAQDANDRILYDQANGNVYYDTNGLTAGGVIHFAEVTNGLALTAADFVVV